MSQTETNSPTFLMPDPSRFEANLGEAKAELMVTFQRILLYLKTCTQDNPRLEELFTRYNSSMWIIVTGKQIGRATCRERVYVLV